MKVMVWGCFWDTGWTGLYIMDRDFESKKHGYSANSYLEVLDAEVAPAYASLDPGYIFMQDNAAIHIAYKVCTWFSDHGITRICKTPTASWGCDSSVMVSKWPWCYDVCRMVDSNLEVMCLTRIRLHCRTNRCPSNMGSKLELSTAPHTLGSKLLQRSAGLIPTLRCHVTVMTFLSAEISNTDNYSWGQWIVIMRAWLHCRSTRCLQDRIWWLTM